MSKQGLAVIISSPAGGGKDAVIKRLLNIFPRSAKIITATSRRPRPREKNGLNYFFFSRAEFEEKIKQGYFLEYNDCAGNYYGIPRCHLDELTRAHDIVFTNIDVNGKRHFDELGIPHLSIFLLPENMDILRQRARRRQGMTAAMIEDRIRLAQEETAQSAGYDCRLVNYDGRLDETVAQAADAISRALKKRLAKRSAI